METLLLIIIGDWKDFMFGNVKFPGYSTISIIRILIQIKLCRHASIQMDLSKNKRFSTQEATKLYSSHREKKEVTTMWKGPLGLCPPNTSNFAMET